MLAKGVLGSHWLLLFPFIFISKLIDLTLKQGDFIAGDVVDGII